MNEHLDLFSGIGGFALAAKWAGFRTITFCEWDKFCQKVLRKNFPDVPIFGDIRELDGTKYKGVELLTGGFPCQPFSIAGKQKGKDDDRYLWPEMLRIISEAQPTWIIGENVAGIVNMALDQVLIDLEAQGYAAWPFIIPACAVGAPHRRDRVWILAYSNSNRLQGREWRMQEIEKPNKTMLSSASYEHAWNNVPTPYFCRASDGIPHRVDRVRSLGNAIVPQLAYEIMKGIK